MASIGPLAFGPDGTLFAADNQNATIVALDLGAQAWRRTCIKGRTRSMKVARLAPGRARSPLPTWRLPANAPGLRLGDAGSGAGAAPTLFRIDGAGKIEQVPLSSLKFQSVELPNPPATSAAGRQSRAPM
jgi:hypothetical protein